MPRTAYASCRICAGQCGLRIEIDDQDAQTQVMKHPRDVIGQRGLANTALVVEEGNGLHGRLRSVTKK